MSNLREIKITENVTKIKLVDSSATGRETIVCLGTWNGAKVTIQTQLSVNGELSPVFKFPDSEIMDQNFSKEINIGHKNALIITVKNASTAELFLKVSTSEV